MRETVHRAVRPIPSGVRELARDLFRHQSAYRSARVASRPTRHEQRKAPTRAGLLSKRAMGLEPTTLSLGS